MEELSQKLGSLAQPREIAAAIKEGAASLANAAFQKPANVLFYATDDTSINGDIEQLIRDNGFEPVRVGGINQSIRI